MPMALLGLASRDWTVRENGPSTLAFKRAVLPLGCVWPQPTQEQEQNQPIKPSHKKLLCKIRLIKKKKKAAGIHFSKFTAV